MTDIQAADTAREALLTYLFDAGHRLAPYPVEPFSGGQGGGMEIGDTLTGEQSGPRELVRDAVLAEAAGFEHIAVDVDGITHTRLADPFLTLTADDAVERLEQELRNPDPFHHVEGSKEGYLVDLLSRLSNYGTALALLAASSAENTAEQPSDSLPGRPRQRQRRLTPAEVDELVAAREAGATMVQLADQFDIKRQTVSKWLMRHGKQ